jgi:predicted lipoprotein with Yx(FWY)xxD motif
MRTFARTTAAAVVIGLFVGSVAGCSDNNKSSGSSTKSATASAGTGGASPSASSTAAETVHTRSAGPGTILVDAQGRSLYLFEADTTPQSTCSGACATAWPPLTVTGAPVAGKGAKADLLGTTTRADGTQQVTYNGHPLYYFQGDRTAGDTNGQGLTQFGAGWFVLDASGNKLAGQATPTGGGGGGY